MSMEDTIAALLEAHLAPIRQELTKLNERLDAVSRRIPPQLVTITEAAQRLGVSAKTVRRRVSDGSLPARRVGAVLRVDLAQLNPPDVDSLM